MKHKEFQVRFTEFLERFPEIELPITLSDDLHHTFSKNNKPLSPLMVQQHIHLYETDEIDELTEYIACFKIPETAEFHAIVYWRAGLMDYQYILITYDKKGNFIDSRTIAGTYSDGDVVTKSVATIDEDWVIHSVSGQHDDKQENYDAASSKTFELELLPDGQIVNSI